MKKKLYQPTIDDQFDKDIVEVVTSDLRALCFWANVGVGSAVDGSRSNDIENIIDSYSSYLKMQLKLNHFKRPKANETPGSIRLR